MSSRAGAKLALGGVLPYDREWLTADAIAGISAGAVVIPQAMGYATVAGVPVEIGLYTCIIPLAVYALLGGSRRLSFSTTSTIVALTGLAVVTVGADGADEAMSTVATLTLMVGVALFLFRVVRLGWMVEAVSEAVIDGLKVGVGLTIIADQLPKLLGITAADGGFLADIGNAIDQVDAINTATLGISLVTIAGLLALNRWAPRVPGPLLAVAGGILLVALTGITGRGVEVIPEVPGGLPIPGIPDFGVAVELIPFALAIAFMAYFESITAARISRDPTDPPLDNNHEYVAVGMAALVGGLFQTVPPAGGFSQTQVNVSAGARSQVSQLVTAALALLVALSLYPVLSDLPQATLGAVVTVAVLGLINVNALVRLGKVSRLELAIALITGLFALFTDLLIGVLVGVLLTFYIVLRTLNHPVVMELRRPVGSHELFPARPDDPTIDGLLVLRVDGGTYTMNIRRVQDQIYRWFESSERRPQIVLVDVGATTDTSLTVIDIWIEIQQHLATRGSDLWIASIPPRALEKARRVELFELWEKDGRIHPSVSAAVARFEEQAVTGH